MSDNFREMFRFREMRLFLFLLLMPRVILAMEPQQLYQMYCSACHALDGAGVAGAAPPLKNSSWVQGDAERSVKIVLHGLQGELMVNDQYFDLVMPPQGAMLNDEQVADILTYVRGSFGNKPKQGEYKVTPELVAQVRKANLKQVEMWQTREILKAHPLPKPVSLVEGLIKSTYVLPKKEWAQLPNFETLEIDNVEEEHLGVLDFKGVKPKVGFAILWEGTFVAPKTGEYKFNLRVDDGARVKIGGKQVVEINKPGPMRRKAEGVIKLEEGRHDLKVEYFQAADKKGLEILVKVPGMKKAVVLTGSTKKKEKAQPKVPVIEVSPSPERVAVYRNFMAGSTPRSIAFGYPGGMNLILSQDKCIVTHLWKGKFVDAGVHWSGRGKGEAKPMGKDVRFVF